MKQYYIKEIDINKINIHDLNIPYKRYTQKIILTNFGYFLFKNNSLFKKKIIINESKQINNFFNNFTLLYNDIDHKHFKFSEHINNENEILEKEIYEIKQNKYSKTKLIIEVINNNIYDIYFISTFSINDLFLKEDIKSLVHLLKC